VMTKVMLSTVTLWWVAFFLSMFLSGFRVTGGFTFFSFGVAVGSLGLQEPLAELEGGLDGLEGHESGVKGVGGTSKLSGEAMATSVLGKTGISILLLLALLPGRVRLPSSFELL